MHEFFEILSFEENSNQVWRIKPKSVSPEKVILYLHGGGYSKGFQNRHWKFISKLVDRTGFEVWAPDYPLSFTSSAEEVFNFLVPVYQKLLEKYDAEQIVLIGDSAGGGMSLALAELLVEKKIELPSQILLLSPWLDITLSNPQIDKFEKLDLIIDRKVLQALGTRYTGTLENTHFLVSPIYGQIKRLPAITVFVGSEEIFLPDCRKLKVRAESEPMVFNYREFKGMVHNWMFLPIPEADLALDMIINQIKLEPREFEDPVNTGAKFW
ncbi:MAG: alpha/beta hydrolase [Balneolaceae bacterium]|nr:alpha/beta hydrolase [Balneolaceae bacterium]MBO6547035.1 alpha/beta hydrolase [Balneolaceae bacterium]MBO6648018.1 alpha/beta hydrolase [Balneolaceae bacterium]